MAPHIFRSASIKRIAHTLEQHTEEVHICNPHHFAIDDDYYSSKLHLHARPSTRQSHDTHLKELEAMQAAVLHRNEGGRRIRSQRALHLFHTKNGSDPSELFTMCIRCHVAPLRSESLNEPCDELSGATHSPCLDQTMDLIRVDLDVITAPCYLSRT